MKMYVVGNWKLNFNVGEASIYLHKLMQKLPNSRNVEVVVAPPLIAMQPLSLQVDRRKLKIAAQNGYYRDFGAYTGETSMTQLRGIADYVIVGHSERRHIFGEDDKLLGKKVAAAIRNGITPILCVGETEIERSFGETTEVLLDQLNAGLSEISEEDYDKVIIAYEPVWAISSVRGSKLATPDDVAFAVQTIRDALPDDTPVLYGGSVSPSNAGAYLTVPGVNGVLVGGSSLILNEFIDIIEIARRVRS